MKKNYIAPNMVVKSLECLQTILWASHVPEPGAPQRQNGQPSVKLTKMYV